MKLKFSVYYRIQQRDEFFERFFTKFSRKFTSNFVEEIKDKYSELLEIIVQMLLDGNLNDLTFLLTKSNAKVARIFFDYLTCSNIKNKKKTEIINRLNELFLETNMINISDYLKDKVPQMDLDFNFENEKIKLNEEDDPFADDGGDDDMGGDDPFADEDGGDSEGGEESDDADSSDDDSDSESKDDVNYDDWEDDPDFTQGVADPSDVTLPDTPPGQSIYDVDGIMASINAVIQSLSDAELAEINQVKKDVELIFNGKILKPEDVKFTNPQNAAFLIKKIGENVDEKTKNYLFLKFKQPLIIQRDQQKLDIADMKKDISGIRDTLDVLDK